MGQPAQHHSMKLCWKCVSCGECPKPRGSQGEKESAAVRREALAQSESPEDSIFTFPMVTNCYAITHLIINFSNKNFISKIQYYPKNQGRNKNALCSIPTQDHTASMCSCAHQPDSAYLCCRKPMKGATPVPGPTMMMGTEGSFGKWKEFAVRGEMDICNSNPTVISMKQNLDKAYN